jgi:hypothetical protein
MYGYLENIHLVRVRIMKRAGLLILAFVLAQIGQAANTAEWLRSQPGANVSVLQMLAQDLNPLDSALRFGIAPACHVAALLGYTGFHSDAVMCNSMGVPKHLPKPGQHLRARRLSLGLTLRDVHMASLSLARELRKPAFVLPPSRLHDIETKEMTPSIHRLYTLTRVYRCRLNELLSWYGIPPR